MQGNQGNYSSWLSVALDPSWIEIVARAWKLGRKIFHGLTNEGIYEVLDYQCQLELKDKSGELARIQKQEKIRYLQDYIISYQDQAWGDGSYFKTTAALLEHLWTNFGWDIRPASLYL
jgi:hypothetical protein